MTDHSERLEAGAQVGFLGGPNAGQRGVIKELTARVSKTFGRRCYVELTTGRDKGKTVLAYTRQLRKVGQ
jgi:hypothetical protein